MRSPINLIAALFMILPSITAPAQSTTVNPQTLPAQIDQQETIVKTPSGSKDSQAWLKLAVLLQDAARYQESEAAYSTTLELVNPQDSATLADLLDHMATLYVESGQLSRAEPIERRALATREEHHDQLGAGVSHMHLAMLLLGEHALSSADAEAEAAVTLLVPEYSSALANSAATPEEKMTALTDLSLVRCASGAYAAAVPSLAWALKIAHANYPDNSIPVGYLNFLLGYADWKSTGPQDAGELMSQGVHELATQIGWGHPAYLRTLRQYRDFLSHTGRTSEARQVSSELKRLSHSADVAAAQPGSPAIAQSLR
jgi:tetratricopeptide (TPR) repeat protein